MIECPICGCTELVEANGRPAALCKGCGAYERTRLMWLVLDQLLEPRDRRDILHFAPERGLAARLSSLGGDGYRALDFEPAGFRIKDVEVERFDLCSDTRGLAGESVDLIVHSHVLEHVPCAVGAVVRNLNAALRPGGYHVFSVPIIGTSFEEDLGDGVSDEERRRRFGQEDHVRRFGREDARAMFTDMFGEDVHFTRLASLGADSLCGAGVPSAVLTEASSHTVFAWRKPVRQVRGA